MALSFSEDESKQLHLAEILPHGVRPARLAGFFKKVPEACTDVCEGVGTVEVYPREQRTVCTRCRTDLEPKDYRIVNFS